MDAAYYGFPPCEYLHGLADQVSPLISDSVSSDRHDQEKEKPLSPFGAFAVELRR